MLIAQHSPLRHPPAGLDRRQQIALDGIRIAADILDLSSHRLRETLLGLSNIEMNTDHFYRAATSAISDAWSIVDNTHRFCELLRQFPQIKKKLPQFELLFRAAKPAEALRHFIQHARNEIDALAQAGFSIWGNITWNEPPPIPGHGRLVRSLHMGTFYSGNYAALGRIPESVESEIDNITLHAGPHKMALMLVIDRVEGVIRGFERDMDAQMGQQTRNGSDILFSLAVTPSENVPQRTQPPTAGDA